MSIWQTYRATVTSCQTEERERAGDGVSCCVPSPKPVRLSLQLKWLAGVTQSVM